MKSHLWSGRLLVVIGALVFAHVGCSGPKNVPLAPVKIAVEGEATPTINRDLNGDPLSVVVRVYHLKDKAEFAKLTFDMVSSGRTDQELLGGDFLGRSEFVMVPGGRSPEGAELTPGTRYIGVVAFFRKPDPNYWRYLISVDQLKQAMKLKKDWKGSKMPLCSFKVQDCYLTMNYIKPEFIPGQPENAKPECTGKPAYAPAGAAAPAPAKASRSSRQGNSKSALSLKQGGR